MALTKISTDGVKDDAITKAKIPADQIEASELANNAVDTNAIADQAVTLDKLPHGDTNNDGKFLRANNGADPSFETINLTSDNISEGNTKAEVVDTGAGYFKVETDGVERFRVNDNGRLSTGGENSPDVDGGGLCLHTGSSDGIFLSCKNSDIDHGRTSLDETDTLFSIRKLSANNGGVDIRGYTDSASADPAIRIFGVIDDGSNSSYCPVELRGARKNSGGNTGTSQMHGNKGVVRISNDGDVTVATFTGEGLCFGSDIETANALDDYEEGTWTPVVGGWDTFTPYSGSTYYYGWYTKVGKIVHCGWKIYIQSLSSVSSSAQINIQGLPFNSSSVHAGIVAHVRFDIPEFGFEGYPLAYLAGSSNLIYMNKHVDGGNHLVSIDATANRSGVWTMGTATYTTA